MENLLKLTIVVVLAICSVQDIRKKKIYLWLILLGGLLIAVCVPFCEEVSMLDRFGGILVGMVVILISVLTRGKIGLADGILLCATGFGLGFWSNLELFGIALFLAAIVSILLLMLRLADRKKAIPFVPFLLLAYLILVYANVRVGV